MQIQTTINIDDVADFVTKAILEKLRSQKRVLFFATGGSSIAVCVRIAEIFREEKDQDIFKNLVVTLTDERYGEVGHKDSNWTELLAKGFSINNAHLIPVLIGGDLETTVKSFSKNLEIELQKADYKIGLFGVGTDGHTAGILPESGAVFADDLVFGYNTPTFLRITITLQMIEKLDQAVVFMQGKEKWPVLQDLKTIIEISKQPAQILKKVPSLTIFTDYKK